MSTNQLHVDQSVWLTVLEWVAAIGVIIAIALNSANVYPLGPIIHLFSNMIWMYVSYQWRKLSLFVLASVSTIVGILFFFVGS